MTKPSKSKFMLTIWRTIWRSALGFKARSWLRAKVRNSFHDDFNMRYALLSALFELDRGESPLTAYRMFRFQRLLSQVLIDRSEGLQGRVETYLAGTLKGHLHDR